MRIEDKYEEALDVLQELQNQYGIKSKTWDRSRVILDRERPIPGSAPQKAPCETVTG
jgi:hypothetical protein